MARALIFLLIPSTCILYAGEAAESTDISKLLDTATFYKLKTREELLGYRAQLEEYLGHHAASDERIAVQKRIGDTCFRLEDYRAMRRWYTTVLAEDPSLEEKTPIGHRMFVSGKILLRRDLITACHAVPILLALVFLIRAVRSKGFDGGWFLKRLGVCSVLLMVGIGSVLAVEGMLPKEPETSDAFYSVKQPIAVYSFHDIRQASLLWEGAAAAFIPVFFAAAHGALKKRGNRILLMVQVLLLSASLWGRWILSNTYDEKFDPVTCSSTTNLFFRGEIEDAVLENPHKIMRANPDFFKSENLDLKEFMKCHFPDGFGEEGATK